jgi:D-3-phosphoglycerate dehydrogenase
MHGGEWKRVYGRRLSEVTIGLIGIGRIGTRVLRHLAGFGVTQVLVNDILPVRETIDDIPIVLVSVDKAFIYKNADIISLHNPLTELTKDMIKRDELLSMKKDAFLINTARGGIINEADLYDVMQKGHLGGAAIDVFELEPYIGPLQKIERCVLTAHMGSMSVDCRTRMEIEATEEAIRFLQKKPLMSIVPESEYKNQEHSS